MAKDILLETQDDRDNELVAYSNLSLKKIRSLTIGAQGAIKVYKDEDLSANSYDFIYKDYKYLWPIDFLRTISAFTVTRRASYILDLEKSIGGFKNRVILDFGSGVGTHGIYCLQKGGVVDFLDVDGPLYNYAKWRITRRGLQARKCLTPNDSLTKAGYDAIICLDVLEHIADPIPVFINICDALRPGGYLSLEVSTMVKPTSGHFSQAIHRWNAGHAQIMKDKLVPIKDYLYRAK